MKWQIKKWTQFYPDQLRLTVSSKIHKFVRARKLDGSYELKKIGTSARASYFMCAYLSNVIKLSKTNVTTLLGANSRLISYPQRKTEWDLDTRLIRDRWNWVPKVQSSFVGIMTPIKNLSKTVLVVKQFETNWYGFPTPNQGHGGNSVGA